MGKRSNPMHSGAPMVELILTIGIFTIISTFLLRMFMAADQTRADAADQSRAILEVETVLEQITAARSLTDAAAELKLIQVEEDGQKILVAYFDKEWKRTDTVSVFTLKVYSQGRVQKAGILSDYRVVVVQDDKELFSASTSRYRRSVRDDEAVE